MKDVIVPAYAIDAVFLALGVAGVLLLWLRGSIFAGWRSYWRACSHLERTPGVSWYADRSWYLAGLGEMLGCRLCLSFWVTLLLFLVGLLPAYVTEGGWRLTSWLVLGPAAMLLGQFVCECAERIFGLKE